MALPTHIFEMKSSTDKTSYFGDLPEVREGQVYIPEGSYQPRELGLYMESLNWIHIGLCRFKPNLGLDGFQPRGKNYIVMAHSHWETGDICLSTGHYVFSKQGVVDEVLLHEYCHILRKSTSKDGHDSAWKALMGRFGLTPSPYMTYVYR